MDISDEELFDVTPSCSTSTTNTSLDLIKRTKDLTPNSEKDSNNFVIKDISVKLTRLSIAKTKEERDFHSVKNKKRRHTWRFGMLKSKFSKRKKASFLDSLQQLKKMDPETTSSEDREMHSNLYNKMYEIRESSRGESSRGKSSREDQEIEQTAQNKTKSLISSTYHVREEEGRKREEEENSYVDTYVCARTTPYEFHRENKTSGNKTTVKDISSFLSTPNSKNTQSSLHSRNSKFSEQESYSSDCSSSNDGKMEERLHSRLKFMVKRMNKNTDKWKFKRKHNSSDSEIEKIFVHKKRHRRIYSSDESNDENASVNNAEAIEDNNLNESHSHKKETNIQINRTARIILTRLEEMKDENVIKWQESKLKSSDIITSEAVEKQQSEQESVNTRNLLILESPNKSTLLEKNRSFESRNIVKNYLFTDSCVERPHTAKSRLNKLKKKYKLFKKPRVLMIKLDTLQCSSIDDRYSASKIDSLTKKYVTSIINSNSQCKSRGLKMYRYVRLQRNMMDAENHNTSPSVSRRQNTNEILKPCFAEETSEFMQDNDENVSFKIHRKVAYVQNEDKFLSPRSSEKKNSQRMEIWRNVFSEITSEKSQKKTASTQSSSTSQTLPISQNLPKKSKCESISILPSTSTTKCNTPVGSPRKLALPKKHTESLTNWTKCNNTSKVESPVSSKNLPSNMVVEKIISKSDFAQSKDSAISKSPRKNASEADVVIIDVFLNSSKKLSELSPKLHEKAINSELATSDTSIKSKTSEVRDVEQSCKKERSTLCTVCGVLFKSYELLKRHMKVHEECTFTMVNVTPTSSNASKKGASMSNETVANKKFNQNLEKLKSLILQRSSVNRESDLYQSDKSVVNFDIAIPSSSSSSSKAVKTHREHFKIPNKKRAKSTTKSKSHLDSSNKKKSLGSENANWDSTNVKQKEAATCKICLRTFETYAQLLQHMFKHMASDLRSMYTSIENEIASTSPEFNKINSKVSENIQNDSVQAALKEVEKGINEQDKRMSKITTNKSSAESLIAPEVSQHDSTIEKDKALNLSATEYNVDRDSEQQSALAVSNKQVQDAEKVKKGNTEPSSEHSTKSFTICKCHKPKTNNKSKNVQIEIVLMCITCQTLFRRFDCFELHCTQQSAEGMLCNKNRRYGRKPKLFCINCQQILNSIQELCKHLVMHARLDSTGTATFCCNICKVVFYGLGQLFCNHFQSHAKNPFFLASRLSFPRPSYVGSKFVKLPANNDNEKSIEVYMQVADNVCQDCRTPFVSSQILKSHKAVCPKATAISIDPRNGLSNSRSSVTKIPILLVCGFCNKTFYSRMSFEIHSLEHTQKREMHMHYTCVAVTALTKVYICKVCTTMWQSLLSFEEHWKTHTALQEVYVCSRCQNHYNNIDQFQKHSIVHKSNNEMQQMPITCEVIYRDISDLISKTNPQKNNTIDDLPCIDLSYFDGKDFVEKTVNDKSREPQESSHLMNALLGDRPTQEAMTSPELSVSNKELQTAKNTSQAPVQVPLPNIAVVQSKRSNNGNSRNFDDDSEEEELTIVLSESEESSISTGIRKDADSMPSTSKHKNMQENPKSTTADSVVADKQCTNDAVLAAALAKTTNDMNESASSNAQINVTPRESVNTQLNTNVSNLNNNNLSVYSTSVSTTIEVQTDHTNNTLKNLVDQSVNQSSHAKFSKEKFSEPLPENVMSSVPKSFLRVKSLAELTNTSPLENHCCQICDMSFESRHRLKAHMSICVHNNCFKQLSRQDKQASGQSSSDNVQVWPAKPMFNSLMFMPTISTQDHPLPSANSNVLPSASVQPNISTRVIDTNPPRYPPATIGVKPLHSVKSNTTADTLKLRKILPHEGTRTSVNNVNATSQHNSQKTAYHPNLPSRVSQPLKKSGQSTQQQSTGTVTVRPFLQTTYPLPKVLPLYSQQEQPQHFVPQQLPQLQQLQQQPQLQQQSQMYQQPQMQQQSQLQQQPQQLFQKQLQQQPQQLQQQLSQQSQQLQQSQQMQQQQIQQTQQMQQLPLQLQPQQSLQQQQQQMNVGNNVMHYLLSKSGMSYQLPNDVIPSNSDNVMLVAVNMQQISKNPDRYVCIYCPDFECGSVQEFALHVSSPKHASNYTNVAYAPQT